VSAISITKNELIFFPKALLEWLDENVGTIHYANAWWFDNDVPAVGDGWRIVKLYQKIGDGSIQTQFYLEFDHDVHMIQFKLSWEL
jgi:hypothetical protein